MKVRINEKDYEQAEWNVQNGVGRFLYPTEDSIVTLLADIGEQNNIEVYDENDVLVSLWYNAGIANAFEIKSPNPPTRVIEIDFYVSILNDNAEEILQNGIDESVDGIFELAEYISELDDEHAETRRRIDMYTESVNEIAHNFDVKQDDTDSKFVATNAQFAALAESISNMQIEITNLQNAISDIPNDIIQRFDALGSLYNALADRVAQLENKEG